MNTTKFIDPKETDIRGLFSTQQVHKVPLHQRTYTWRKDQWEELFDDIAQLSEEETHFLGSIVVIPDQLKLGVNFFQIQDGQQRLATIVIFMCVLRDLAEEEKIQGSFQDYLYAKDYNGNLIPRLQLSELDNNALISILEKKDKAPNHLISECYDYFQNRIKKESPNTIETDISKLWSKLLERVYVVHINAFNDFNAFQLFETLNDRGLELSAVDLIKNFLLQKVSRNEGKLKDCVSQWTKMFENVRDIEPIKFFRRYMLSSLKGKVSERRLNKALRSIIEREKWDIDKILTFARDLNKKSIIYSHIYKANFLNASKINKKLQDLHLVEVAPSYTLLLKLFPLYESGLLSEENIIEVLEMIEIFHIRWGVCGQSTSALDTIYNDISTSSIPILESVKNRLNKEIKENVDDTVFENNFVKRSFKPSEKRTKYIHWRLSKPTGETMINIGEIWTEHIMPQTLSKDWIEYLKNKTGLSENDIIEKHKGNLDRIGNLTIIKGKWNDEMKNNLFEIKKNHYEKSEFSITKDLCKRGDWTFKEIEERSKSLSELAVKEIWKWHKSEHFA
jgi:uncharacterized protein with ParB-like and HNH nuclease domain